MKGREQAADFIKQRLRGADGRLLARWRDGEAAFDAKLEDCAFYAWGLIALYETTFRTEYLERAIALGDQLLAEFFDAERGGFYPYSERGEQLLTRTKDLEDGAMPSGNGMAALVLSRLGRLTGETRFIEAEERQLRYLAGAIERYPGACCVSLLAMLEYLEPTEELVVCAARAAGSADGVSARRAAAEPDRAAENAGDGEGALDACALHGGVSDSRDRRDVLPLPQRRLRAPDHGAVSL